MHDKVKPVYGPHQAALDKQLQLLNEMWWVIWGQPQGQAGYYKKPPRDGIQKFYHVLELS